MRLVHANVPATVFAMVLGIGGLSSAWRSATVVYGFPAWIGEALAFVAIAVWLLWLVLFTLKWCYQRVSARSELTDPVASFFVVLVPMATLIASIALQPYQPMLAEGMFILAAAGQVAFAAWSIGGLWIAGTTLQATTPATYMPAVGGFFLSALAAGTFGHADAGLLLWGAGFVSWLIWESVVLHRLITQTLPLALRSTLGIHLAPPAVASVAYLAVTDGPPDRLVQAIFGYALLQALIAVRIFGWIREQPFSPSAWAYTFGISTLPLAAIRLVERGQTGPIAFLAVPLFFAANAAVAWIACRTIVLLLTGDLLERPMSG